MGNVIGKKVLEIHSTMYHIYIEIKTGGYVESPGPANIVFESEGPNNKEAPPWLGPRGQKIFKIMIL